MAANGLNSFGIRDNHSRGKVADFIKEKVSAGSTVPHQPIHSLAQVKQT